MIGVTFDFGQTLAKLDSRLLAERLAERGVVLDAADADRESAAAWQAYNQAKRAGGAGSRVWAVLMRTLLSGAGAPPNRIEELVDWLWSEQPKRNLWRRPIPGMVELARELREAGVAVGVLSNSEGRLAELISELGWGRVFQVVVDSGRLPFEKPDPRIFEHAAAALGVSLDALIHVGDAWEADVRGALGVGARAIYFGDEPRECHSDRLATCADAAAVRATLAWWGVLGPQSAVQVSDPASSEIS